MSEPIISELEFLRKLQRLLDEGDFSATYKFALLNALADLSVECEPDLDGSLRIALEAVATRFLEYYWPQARPYGPSDGEGFVFQNAARQALVINVITWPRISGRCSCASFSRSAATATCSTRFAGRGAGRSCNSARTGRCSSAPAPSIISLPGLATPGPGG